MGNDLKDNVKLLAEKKFKLTDKDRKRIYSPARLVATIALSIFISEIVIMSVIEIFDRMPDPVEILLDATLLTLFVSLVLYFLLFKPLLHLVNDCRINEEELKIHKANLEVKISQRTRELEIANINLIMENYEHIKAKKALEDSEERFYRLFEESEDAIVLVSVELFSILDVNPVTENIFGKSKEKIESDGLSYLCDVDACNIVTSAIEQIVQTGEPNSVEEFKFIREPDDVRCLSLRGKIITIKEQKVVYLSFRDITARVRLEEDSREIQSRLIQANRMTSLGTMISSVAHELNNPNNFLLMNARILLDAKDDIMAMLDERYREKGDFMIANLDWEEARIHLPEAVEGIQQGAIRISDIIGNLKTVSRDESANKDPEADVNKVVQLSVSILSYLISSYTDNFELELAENMPLVRGFERQLEQVVINLIQNALQALPDKNHSVKVSTMMDRENQYVLIRVHDNGKGLPVEIASRIMEPFFTTRLEQGGTGLGLAICSAIVKEFDGLITFVSSGSGHGTTFTVSLCQAITTSTEAG